MLLFISCGEENIQTTELCKSIVCNDWQECNKTSGKCESKENFCSINDECIGYNIYCDTESHTCKEYNKCTTTICQEWEECNLDNGNCKVKEGYCNTNNDCNENKFCEETTHSCKDKTSFNCIEDINCDNHGICVYYQNNAQCNCDEGYYSPTFGHCKEITCATYNEGAHEKETAKELTEVKEEEEVCKNLNNFYKFSGVNSIIKISAESSTVISIYKNEIKEESLIDSKSGNSNFFINNTDNSTYYLLVMDNNQDSNYSILYKDGCLSDNDCFEDYPTCNTNNKCIKVCTQNNECGYFGTCQDGICIKDLCQSHDDCFNQDRLAYCMANHHCEYMSTCYANESICEAKIDIQQNSFVCDKLSFDNFHGCVPVTPLELGENNFSFSLTNIYPIWFKYTLNEVSSLKYDIELTNSSQFIEKNLYAFLVKNNEELSAYSSGNSMLNLDAKYLEANTYYLNLFPFEFQAITATSHDFKINLQAENEVCEDNSDCYEVLGRSICEENSCKVNNSFGNVSLNHRCDLDKNCNSVFYEPVCLDRVSSLDNSFGGLCSLPCGLGGIESDIYCSEKLNSSGYYCTEYNERNYCLPRCSNDSDCLIGLNQGRCIMDNQRNANICIFN